MNYSFIEFAQKQIATLEDNCSRLAKEVSLALFSLTKTNLPEARKQEIREDLLEHTNNIIREAEKILDRLRDTRFSESEAFLLEENNRLIRRYWELIEKKLGGIKATISRQDEGKVMVITPLRQRPVKSGYCYFCDTSIVGDFAYKLNRIEQDNLGVEIAEGAAFCSQKCLKKYRKEYREREELRQEEKEKNGKKIERDREMITEIQEQIGSLNKRINRLERREKELELVPESYQVEKPENTGFFRRLGQKLGLARKPNPLSKLERVRKLKAELNIQLEESEEELKEALFALSLDEQKEAKRKRLEEKSRLEKERITAKNEEEAYD